MNDAGFELRHIMFISGHKNESSVRSLIVTALPDKKLRSAMLCLPSLQRPRLGLNHRLALNRPSIRLWCHPVKMNVISMQLHQPGSCRMDSSLIPRSTTVTVCSTLHLPPTITRSHFRMSVRDVMGAVTLLALTLLRLVACYLDPMNLTDSHSTVHKSVLLRRTSYRVCIVFADLCH